MLMSSGSYSARVVPPVVGDHLPPACVPHNYCEDYVVMGGAKLKGAWHATYVFLLQIEIRI